MSDQHNWMPNRLFDIALFCEQVGLRDAREILVDTAIKLHISLLQMDADKLPPRREDRPPYVPGEGAAVIPLRKPA